MFFPNAVVAFAILYSATFDTCEYPSNPNRIKHKIITNLFIVFNFEF